LPPWHRTNTAPSGPLTKRIRLDPDGSLMAAGVAERDPALRDFLDRALRHYERGGMHERA
jgi:hypothetical protein